MSKTLLAIIGSIVVLGFVYMHFEWFPGHSGPDRETAQVEITRWAQAASGQSTPDVRIARISVPDDEGVSAVEVAFGNFYFERDGAGQHYTGKGRIDFVRAGPLLRPRWEISNVNLLDQTPPAVLPASLAK